MITMRDFWNNIVDCEEELLVERERVWELASTVSQIRSDLAAEKFWTMVMQRGVSSLLLDGVNERQLVWDLAEEVVRLREEVE